MKGDLLIAVAEAHELRAGVVEIDAVGQGRARGGEAENQQQGKAEMNKPSSSPSWGRHTPKTDVVVLMRWVVVAVRRAQVVETRVPAGRIGAGL